MKGFNLRNVGDVKIATINGNLDTSAEVDVLLHEVLRPNLRLLIDMGSVRKVSPVALRQLEFKKKEAETQGVEIRILHVNGIRDTQTLTQLALLFPTHWDEAAAVRSFS